ncbi:amino acid ABC transporter permease [Loigolactobacillus coryniformis]|uniref:amino acid ABC transporter permease n=1 Tax=Loigolactobacillus coryniformis TaxID=1610 RepID=UPI0023408828|nr:amino acid ABC transporter permease [Loigolactobacillus coryniformis]MDC4186103.1 amino acid ABC transporter permease [Loigolactobacillus coryniformis]
MSLNTDFMWDVAKTTLKGVPVTLEIVLVALVISLPISFLFAIARIYQVKGFNQLIRLYVSFVRGTPIIAQILIVYSAFPSLLATIIGKSAFAINPINYAYIVFTLNSIATLTEVFRSALQTIDRGQLEAGLMVGISPSRTFIRIILPQALVSALPNIANATLYLVKNSSLAFIMSVKDITAIAKTQAAFSYNFLESYLVLWVYYLVISYGAEILFKLAENYFGRFRLQVHSKFFKSKVAPIVAVDPNEKEVTQHAYN